MKYFIIPSINIFILCTILYLIPNNLLIFNKFNFTDILIILIWGNSTWLLNRFIYKVYFRGVLVMKNGIPIPTLLENVTSVLIWVFSFLIFLTTYFDYDLTGLWATSSVTIAVLGFALRGMLMDIFSGIAMGIERPFQIGDWIKTDTGIVGCVEEMNWRVTKIITRENIITILPNSLLSTGQFQNYGNGRFFRETIALELSYDIDTKRAERILLSSVNLVTELQHGFREADTQILDFTPRGVKWELRFWLNDYESKDDIIYEIKKNILSHLHYSGVEIPREKVDMLYTKNNHTNDLASMLKNIEFIKCLQEDELSQLSQVIQKHSYSKDEKIIRYNQMGNSLFLLLEGVLSVHIPKDNERDLIEIAKIKPGDFFGEMSLLTGAPRSATVSADMESIVFEIKQEHLKPILENREDILNFFADYIQQREKSNQKEILKSHLNDIEKEEEKKGTITQLKKLFSIL